MLPPTETVADAIEYTTTEVVDAPLPPESVIVAMAEPVYPKPGVETVIPVTAPAEC